MRSLNRKLDFKPPRKNKKEEEEEDKSNPVATDNQPTLEAKAAARCCATKSMTGM